MTAPAACQVRVGVRIRPLTSNEHKQGGKQVLQVAHPSIAIAQRRFTYDAVFDAHVSQQELYESVSKPLLGSFIDGYNATIMAYGQTGSGKTFTMGSEAHPEPESLSHSGLIPRFLADMFAHLDQMKDVCAADHISEHEGNGLLSYQMKASFLEVYGEDVFDLLDRQRKSLPLREDANGGVVISGLSDRTVRNATEALDVLHDGTMNRTTAATLMNLTSSRSHAVFTIYLTQTTRDATTSEVDVTTTSRFTFVDLAGSERMKKTGAEGERAREGIKINEGLLALGNVINALADDERLAKDKKVHVPYRQSKLTRLLQDALGGNSQTLFLACVSPSDTNVSETLSTLHYANRARNIKNAPTKNIDSNVLELQRLYCLTRVLQCELVKQRFKTDDNVAEEDNIGAFNDNLMQRDDVVAYLQKLSEVAAEQQDSKRASPKPTSALAKLTIARRASMEFSTSIQTQSAIRSGLLDATPNKSILDKFDDTWLDDVNPETEMAILDQLLEVQHQDQKYGEEFRKDTEQLRLVDGELAEQEAMLLQLRESLKIYHNMKQKYEALMAEVQQLELEKVKLADELEKAKADPTMGCSASIKRKMEKVEQSLARAKTETRKHREMYRKAEQQAQKCRALEHKIKDLKQGKVNLIKKQKETEAKHRDYTEAKAREINTLKRKERATEKRVSKLEADIQICKSNLEKRQRYNDKLSEKLKQTEDHLMKMLAMRKRDFSERTSVLSLAGRRSSIAPRFSVHQQQGNQPFAEMSEDVKSIKFVLRQLVNDKVNEANLRRQYEESVAEYGTLMRKMVAEMKQLQEARKNNEDADILQELEHNVEELELRVELLGSDLEDLKSRLPSLEDGTDKCNGFDAATKVIAAKPAPVLRTLLLDTIEELAQSEIASDTSKTAIGRKESALEIMENEVETLSNRIEELTKDLARRRRISGEDTVEMVATLEEEKMLLKKDLQEKLEKIKLLNLRVEELQSGHANLTDEFSLVKEKLTLANLIDKHKDGVHPSEEFLSRAQDLWQELGVDPSHREAIRRQIESCLEDTCARKLQEETVLKEKTTAEIQAVGCDISTMQNALGISSFDRSTPPTKLLKQLDWLKSEQKKLEPTFSSAIQRREKIVQDVESITSAMMVPAEHLSEELQQLLQQYQATENLKYLKSTLAERESNVSFTENGAPTVNLSDGFLAKCEKDVSDLRLKKADILVQNAETRASSFDMAHEMNMSQDDVAQLSLHSIKQRMEELPNWWNHDAFAEAASSVARSDGVVSAGQMYSKHLGLIQSSLASIANGRRKLSAVLREIVTRAQKTLLDTVEREIDASEAYASFHDALFRLPSLSKEFVDACIAEINALVTGVETMTQSEIEALTVVWEALNVSISERGKFWSEMDESTKAMKSSTDSPFDDVLRTCALDKEQWVLDSVKRSRGKYKELEIRLFKLRKIHEEVEKLRARQDRKSRIITLDSELRLLSTRLADFEDKKCGKQRLLTKKTASSTLLKEEKFRKQMQTKFSASLEHLDSLLKEWKEGENESFDPKLLSTEVRSLLTNADSIDNWVEKQTEFMHLRTVKSIGLKRKTELSTRLTPPRKRQVRSPLPGKSRESAPIPTGKSRPLEPLNTTKKRKPDASSTSKPQPTSATKTSKLQRFATAAGTAFSPKTRANKRESTTLLPFGNILSESKSNTES